MSDENLTGETTEETPEPQGEGVPLADIWAAHYNRILPHVLGDTNNKADKQAYRLKAMDIALQLLVVGLQVNGVRPR